MNVLVTGATGFIGKRFCELEGDYEVYKLSSLIRLGSESRIDSNLIQALENKDVVLHLAGLAHNAYSENDLDEVNHLGSLEIAIAAEKAGVKRFIFLSTVNVHGLISSTYPLSESSQQNFNITASKVKAEKELLRLGEETGMEITIIRSVLVYGKGAPANMGLLIKLASSLPLSPFGLLKNRRSYISVLNLCGFISLCINHPKAANEVFLISDDCDISTKELMDLMASGIGRKLFHIPIPVYLLKLIGYAFGRTKQIKQLTENLQVDISKAKNILGWSPIETMEQAMSKLK